METLESAAAKPRDGGRRLVRSAQLRDFDRIIAQIDTLCDAFGVGTRIPAHRDLMTRFDTSERTVLAALAELQRQGRIVRRSGSGTYVASEGTDALRRAPSSTHAAAPRAISQLIVVASHDNGYFSRAIEMAFRCAQSLELGVTYEPPDFERLAVMAESPSSADCGFIVIGSHNILAAKRLQKICPRIVGVGDRGVGDHIPFACVHPDNMLGGYMAARHLLDGGHTCIGYLMAGDNPRLWGHDRAVREARDAGREVRSVVVPSETFREWQGHPDLGRAMFDRPDHPTGFCAWNDSDAIRLLTFLMSIGLKVPQDISIVGYDNLPVSGAISPALTTVETRLEDQVALALSELINPIDLPRHSIVVDPDLIIRESTRTWN